MCLPTNHVRPIMHTAYLPPFKMRDLCREVNKFLSTTSIHGLLYISETQSRPTRIVWTLVVLAGFVVTSYFLYNTLDGFDEKYVSTTIETKSIQDYHFPAVTFHPSGHNSEDAFKRTFLNQFEFTRYDENSPLRDNEDFVRLFRWLIAPMHIDFLNDIESQIIFH